jgi:tetratricopeptide (TPR) repeat protein
VLQVATEARRWIDRDRVRDGLDAMARAMPDIEATIERAVARGDGDLACATAATLNEYCEIRGGRIHARELLLLALGLPCAPGTRADALNGLGLMSERLRRETGIASLEEARVLADQVGDVALAADIETNLGNALIVRGRHADGEALLRSSQARWHSIGNPPTSHRLAPDMSLPHDLDGHERVLGEVRKIANAFTTETTLYNIAEWYRRFGDVDLALRHNQEGLRIAVSLDALDAVLDDLEAIAEDLERLGWRERAARLVHGVSALRAVRPERPSWQVDLYGSDAAGHQASRPALLPPAEPPLPLERLIELALEEP